MYEIYFLKHFHQILSYYYPKFNQLALQSRGIPCNPNMSPWCISVIHSSSNIGTDRAGFLGVCRDVQRGVQASTGCRGCAGMCRGVCKPPQGATQISMRERRALIGRKAYVHPVTYAIAVLYRVYQKKLNKFEIALNVAKQLKV